jgi:curved DNA-binding protein
VKRDLRKEDRRPIAGEVGIAWQDSSGRRQFCNVRGVDLSESGVSVESPVALEVGSYVQVHAEEFGFNWPARVRHCQRRGSRYIVGLEFRKPRTAPPEDIAREEFADLYDLMQISPTADTETVHRVYRLMAARYHPDNVHTGDLQKFLLLQKALDTLSDPIKRAAYDAEYSFRRTGPMPVFELKDFVVGIDVETNRRLGILCLLYNRRRINPDKPGLSLLEFEQLMTIPREHLVFTVWYLKERQLLRTEGGAEFEITADGVQFVESSLPSNRLLQKLLRAPADAAAASAGENHSTDAQLGSYSHKAPEGAN